MHDNKLREHLFRVGLPIAPVGGEIFFVAKATSQAWEWLRSRTDTHKIFNTINEAINACTASRGDSIVVAPYHTETVSAADGVDLDVAGVQLLGMGVGNGRPLLDFTNAAGELVLGAADVGVDNFRLHANVPDVLIGIEIEAAADNFRLTRLHFDVETTGTDEFKAVIQAEAGANGGLVADCYCDMGLGNATGFFHMNGASTNHQVLRNFVTGDYSTANIYGSTAASTVLNIGQNILQNGTGTNIGAQPCIELNGNSTGIIWNNYCACNLATKAASIVAAGCFLFENYYNEDISGAATGGIIGTASADD